MANLFPYTGVNATAFSLQKPKVASRRPREQSRVYFGQPSNESSHFSELLSPAPTDFFARSESGRTKGLTPSPKRRCVSKSSTSMEQLHSSAPELAYTSANHDGSESTTNLMHDDSSAVDWSTARISAGISNVPASSAALKKCLPRLNVPNPIAVPDLGSNNHLSAPLSSSPINVPPDANFERSPWESLSPSYQPMCAPNLSPQSWSSGTSLNAWTSPTSIEMSRRSSHGTDSICKSVNLMRVNSHVSDGISDCGEDLSQVTSQSSAGLLTTGAGAAEPTFNLNDTSHSISHAGGGVDTTPDSILMPDEEFDLCLPGTVSSQTLALPVLADNEGNIASSTMQRQITSLSPYSNKRSIGFGSTRQPSLSGYPSINVEIAPRHSNDTVKISRTRTSARMSDERVKCRRPDCKEQPEGYKGEHEERRHFERAHRHVRPVFMCANRSENPFFLSKCKACSSGKLYNADYNAGSHLRRIHFHPRQHKTKRGRMEAWERRGGRGGGCSPPMEELRKYMVTFEVTQRNERVTEPRKVDESSDLIMPDMADYKGLENAAARDHDDDTPSASAFDDEGAGASGTVDSALMFSVGASRRPLVPVDDLAAHMGGPVYFPSRANDDFGSTDLQSDSLAGTHYYAD